MLDTLCIVLSTSIPHHSWHISHVKEKRRQLQYLFGLLKRYVPNPNPNLAFNQSQVDIKPENIMLKHPKGLVDLSD